MLQLNTCSSKVITAKSAVLGQTKRWPSSASIQPEFWRPVEGGAKSQPCLASPLYTAIKASRRHVGLRPSATPLRQQKPSEYVSHLSMPFEWLAMRPCASHYCERSLQALVQAFPDTHNYHPPQCTNSSVPCGPAQTTSAHHERANKPSETFSAQSDSARLDTSKHKRNSLTASAPKSR